jgi:hypothetical protein
MTTGSPGTFPVARRANPLLSECVRRTGGDACVSHSYGLTKTKTSCVPDIVRERHGDEKGLRRSDRRRTRREFRLERFERSGPYRNAMVKYFTIQHVLAGLVRAREWRLRPVSGTRMKCDATNNGVTKRSGGARSNRFLRRPWVIHQSGHSSYWLCCGDDTPGYLAVG